MGAEQQGAVAWPRTVIVIHPRERRSKCSVEPLRHDPEYIFTTFPHQVPIDLTGYVRLGIGGPQLSESDAGSGLLLLDGTWKRAAGMLPFYQHLPVRSLPSLKTAYPESQRFTKIRRVDWQRLKLCMPLCEFCGGLLPACWTRTTGGSSS